MEKFLKYKKDMKRLSHCAVTVGELVLQSDECFWIIPSEDFFNEKSKLSPWFTYLGETWQIVKEQYRHNDCSSLLKFYFWRKVRFSSSKSKYKALISLELSCPEQTVESTEDIHYDGCEFNFDWHCPCGSLYFSHNHIVSHDGFVKFFFKIQKREDIDNGIKMCDKKIEYSSSNEDDKRNDDVGNGDEASDGHERSDEDECTVDETATEWENADEPKGIKKSCENLKETVLEGHETDIVLKISNHEYNAHRWLLVARSPVFATMLERDVDKNTIKLDVPDSLANTFKIFLYYLYTNSTDKMTRKNAWSLYFLAFKYRVHDLMKHCAELITLSSQHEENKSQKSTTNVDHESRNQREPKRDCASGAGD